MVSRLAAGGGALVAPIGPLSPSNVPGDADPPASLRLVRVSVPLRHAHVAAHGAESIRDVVLIAWSSSSGETGWGECPTLSGPGYAVGTTDEAWRLLVGHLAPAVLAGAGLAVAAPHEGSGAWRAAAGALADARLDATLRADGRSLRTHLGAARTRVPRCVVLAGLGDTPSQLARRASEAVVGGASLVKVKIAPGHDVEVLAAIGDAIGASRTAADANGSYSDPGALAEVDSLGLRYLEQPFDPALPWAEAAAWHRSLATAVALDEPLRSIDDVEAALRAGAADVVSVKPARIGGVEAAATAVALARAAGVDAFVGGMLELGIGRATAAALAGLEGCTLPTDLGPSRQYVDRDICEPIETDEEGALVLPDGPGIGRVPDESVLGPCVTAEVVLAS